VREEPRLEVSDPLVMRALAHPARLAIMDYFFAGNTGTATDLAEVVRLSPSATSYHLRALARSGLVEEAPGRGDARERVWQTRIRGLTIAARSDGDADAHEAERELTDAILVREDAQARRWVQRSADEPPEWYQAASIIESVLRLTAAELTELNEAMAALYRPYSRRRRTDPPPDARMVSLVVRAFPVDGPGGGADTPFGFQPPEPATD
jgi:DNA-binding transcriptional ArsR family regulator